MSALILYDDDCGLCKWLVQWLLAWDRSGRLRTRPIQRAGGLLDHLSHEERMASWHLAQPGQAVVSSGAAFPPLLRMLPGGAPLAALTARFPRATERAYRWVAANRTILSKPLRASWKQAAARRVAARHG